MKRLAAIVLPALLCGCASGEPNHIGNPLTLPGRGIVNGIQNAAYAARRNRLSDYVNANLSALYVDIDAQTGSTLHAAMDIARVPNARRAELAAELNAHPEIYRQADTEPLIVAIMVHGD